VYRRVHPDLLGTQPTAQKVNLRSMQEVQALWENLGGSTEDQSVPASRKRRQEGKHVTFFYSTRSKAAADLEEEEQEVPLSSVSAYVARDVYGFKRGILKIASELYPDDARVDELLAKVEKSSGPSMPSSWDGQGDILSFLRSAGESARRGILNEHSERTGDSDAAPSLNQAVTDEMTEKIALFQTGIQRVYGLQVLFASDLSTKAKNLMCIRLAKAVEDAFRHIPRAELACGMIEINGGDKKHYIGPQPPPGPYQNRLILGACLPYKRWVETIRSMNFTRMCASERELQTMVHEFEVEAARVLSVDLLLSARAAHWNEDYIKFLTEIKSSPKARVNPQKKFPRVDVLVEINDGSPKAIVPPESGVVVVQLEEGARAAMDRVRTLAPGVNEEKQRAWDASQTAGKACRQLRAKEVKRGKSLGLEEWIEGTSRLLGLAPAFRGTLDGVRIILDRELSVDPDKGEVSLPYNLELD